MVKKKKDPQMDINEFLDEKVEEMGKLNEVIIKRMTRANGTRRIQQDFSNCPSMAEQHTAHMTDINYLMEKHKPDELAAYIAARNSHRQMIVDHDFSREPELQDAMTVVYRSQQAFENMDPELKQNFRNHVEFLKFIDNPANEEKLIKLGLLKREQIKDLKIEDPNAPVVTPATPTT